MLTTIVADLDVLGGKPRITGTRLSVDVLLELFASGASREDLLAAYPQLTHDALSAALTFAARVVRSEQVWDVNGSA
jgi:uncharacterized protein (DUF433 family)